MTVFYKAESREAARQNDISRLRGKAGALIHYVWRADLKALARASMDTAINSYHRDLLRYVDRDGHREDVAATLARHLLTDTPEMMSAEIAALMEDAEAGDGVIEHLIRWNSDGSFHRDELQDLRADYVLANPPFNVSDWGGNRLREDVRWKYGAPPAGNANFAWLQHILHHLAPTGTAGVVLANGSMSSTQSGEGEIRQVMVEGDVIDCMIAMPGQLFYSTQIPVCQRPNLQRGRKRLHSCSTEAGSH